VAGNTRLAAHVAWQAALFQAVEQCGTEGAAATEYLRTHRTYVGFRRVGAHVGRGTFPTQRR
jgi:hypothetical protein